ncbi:MAG: hypoxanthine phosphoribosyltransferase [Clostridia bacterium]|nr:hypoxanthine phosphoribosyltransferase [Clostridia bacterium]
MAQEIRIGNIMITEEEISKKVADLAKEINADFPDGELVVVGILKGCIMFLCDLSRKLTSQVRLDFMQVSSYGSGTESSGEIKIKKDLEFDIAGKNVLIVEDIIDSGNTMVKLIPELQKRNPASVKVCALISKPSRRQVEYEADYTGFEITDKFIIGYGLDCDEMFRQLPYIAEADIVEL